MDKPEFVYVTYILSTPEKVWNALVDGEITKQYWFRHREALARHLRDRAVSRRRAPEGDSRPPRARLRHARWHHEGMAAGARQPEDPARDRPAAAHGRPPHAAPSRVSGILGP